MLDEEIVLAEARVRELPSVKHPRLVHGVGVDEDEEAVDVVLDVDFEVVVAVDLVVMTEEVEVVDDLE